MKQTDKGTGICNVFFLLKKEKKEKEIMKIQFV